MGIALYYIKLSNNMMRFTNIIYSIADRKAHKWLFWQNVKIHAASQHFTSIRRKQSPEKEILYCFEI